MSVQCAPLDGARGERLLVETAVGRKGSGRCRWRRLAHQAECAWNAAAPFATYQVDPLAAKSRALLGLARCRSRLSVQVLDWGKCRMQQDLASMGEQRNGQMK